MTATALRRSAELAPQPCAGPHPQATAKPISIPAELEAPPNAHQALLLRQLRVALVAPEARGGRLGTERAARGTQGQRNLGADGPKSSTLQ